MGISLFIFIILYMFFEDGKKSKKRKKQRYDGPWNF
jgi:hypothetical protein